MAVSSTPPERLCLEVGYRPFLITLLSPVRCSVSPVDGLPPYCAPMDPFAIGSLP